MLRILKQNYPVRNVFFVIGEFFAIFLSGFLATLTINGYNIAFTDQWLVLKILLIAFVCQACLYYNDLYDLKVTDNFSELSIRLLQALGASAILLAGIYQLFPGVNVGLEVFVTSIGLDILFIVSWRFAYTLALNNRLFDRKIIILGSGTFGRDILREVNDRKDCGYVAAGVVLGGDEVSDTKMLDMLLRFSCDCEWDTVVINHEDRDKLCDIVKSLDIMTIVVALKERNHDFPVQELLKCRVNGIDVLDGNTFYEMLTGKLIVDHIQPEWLIFSDGFQKSRSQRFLKRIIDLSLSFILLILLFPLIILTAIVIKLDWSEPDPDPKDIWGYFAKLCAREKVAVNRKVLDLIRQYTGSRNGTRASAVWQSFREKCGETGCNPDARVVELVREYIDRQETTTESKRPVIFSQERMGMNGRIYRIHKFRSMIVTAERYSGPVWAGENDKRITWVGNILRKTRIDEIPQIWNVLRGEMSFVGPRPEREHFVKQLEETIPYYRERLTVKPGLTGWAQVSYGYGASEDDAREKLNYDLFYIKNMSILLDLMIVLKTVKIVIFGKGR